jgi:protocatechuate 3,4-dioxygenase beta subunit
VLRDLAAFVFVVMPVRAQEPKPATAAAEPTVVLEGRVVDLRGEPVPLASISVVTWQDPEHVLARSVCDGEGYFRIGKVPKRDSWLVLASSEGRCRGQTSIWGDPKPLLIEVHDAASLRGALRNRAGQPVAGAIVRAELVARILFGVRADARTDDEGRFVLQGVPLGFVRVTAVVPGEGLAVKRQHLAEDADTTLVPGDGPTTSMRIEVEGLPEDAIAQFTASIRPYGSLEHFPPPWDKPVFDKEGRCDLLNVPDLEYLVSASAPGFVFAPREHLVKQGKGPHVLRFVASRRGSEAMQCKATLKGPDGCALAGVTLVMRATSGREQGAEATSATDGGLTLASPVAAGTEAVIYSLDDRWVLDQPKGGETLGARDRRFLGGHKCVVDPATTLELRVVPACTVTGRVLLGDGRPAAFASVQLENERTERIRWMTFARATTDRAGNYRFRRCHHLDEVVRIKVEGRSGSASSEAFALSRAGAVVTLPELKLAPPAAIEGTVCDAQQKPAPGIRVWLRDWDFAKNSQSGSLVEVITDRQGRYRFLGVPPGGTWLQLLSDGEDPTKSAVEPFEVEAGKTYTHDLQLSRQ